jgi:hypothetical protein
MRFKLFAFVWFAALAVAPITLSADGTCCDTPAMACCDKAAGACDMPCCQDDATLSAVDVLIAMDQQAIVPGATHQHASPRQAAVVFFQRPVWVGSTVLMGKHVIEHDTDRQARGEPCTHIYAADDLKTPVATFHCTHLDTEKSDKAMVVLQTTADGQQKFLQFQFAGDEAAHGFPTDR